MTLFLLILWMATSGALAVVYFLKQRAERTLVGAKLFVEKTQQTCAQEIARAEEASRSAVTSAQQSLEQRLAELAAESESIKAKAERASQAAVAYAQQTLEQRLAELAAESERISKHYESEALRVHEAAIQQLDAAFTEMAPLRAFANLQDAENEVRRTLVEAIAEAGELRKEAQLLVDQTRVTTADERNASHQRLRELQLQADALLTQATRDAGRITAAAEQRAEQIGGDAYLALREKEALERAVHAIRNVVEGYGDRYIIPTHSLLDELAADFGHTGAGEALRAAREQSRRMVVNGEAADCDYAETNRRETAIRFVIDAFNGRTDGLLSTVKHNNVGTLEQEIRDAFSLVNLHGQAFRNARILPAYLDARLAELKWAVITQELRLKEREEQRAIQERIREEEKARREYERAIQEAAREEAAIKQAMAKARAEVENASAEERARFEAELAELSQRLSDAEAKGERALSMAQQTRAGNVYVISNVGSFGEGVLKIGMTRRLIPEDRIKELGDASVPFAFDVHAMIRSDDAPTLERMLHLAFDDARINKVNYRKEFFRVPLERLRNLATEKKLDVTFTMAADAREYRETVALEKMTPEEREKYLQHEPDEDEPLTIAVADLQEE